MKPITVSNNTLQKFKQEGIIIVPNVIESIEINPLIIELEDAISEDNKSRPDAFDCGMVHNCMFRGEKMASLLDNPILNGYIKEVLSPSCIMYAFQSSSAPPNGSNFGNRIHVDSPRFIPNYITNIGVIFPLNDFTTDNGATRFLSGSHKVEDLPSKAKFDNGSTTVQCRAGDMIIFNARLAHKTGVNSTSHVRHALTINICRSFMRQRFDFCNMPDAKSKTIKSLGVDGKRLLGMNVRMPKSLDEFYLPAKKRLYKPGQE